MQKKILLTECHDATGLIAHITKVCEKHQLNITNNKEFVDNVQRQFYMRTELEGQFDDSLFLNDLDDVLPSQSKRKLISSVPKKIVVIVTKESHCLGDLLMKTYDGSLHIEISAVIGNYQELKGLTEKFDISYYTVSHEGISREQHEDNLIQIIDDLAVDYIVLAKYMRVLTPRFVAKYAHKIINIHHSFLPAFIGAKPYQQAYERGVKIIGATAHFVTDDLDEGPIIKQQVIPVDHNFTAKDMAKAGRDVEKHVLSKALDLVVQDRVFINGNRTVIL